ncbi:hypothetical protein ACFSQ7_39830 [Paenibacillus rhizoplanae]
MAGQSLVDLIRQHIPFADKLINKNCSVQPGPGPAAAASGACGQGRRIDRRSHRRSNGTGG